MTISDKILPIRFYDDLFDQNRFNKTCHETCQFDLVYPSSKLPHFQLTRDAIFPVPSSMFLRNVCNDIDNNYYKEIPEGADSFCNEELVKSFYTFKTGEDIRTIPFEVPLQTTIPLANYLVELFDIDCCAFKMLSANIPNNVTLSYIPLTNPVIFIPISSATDKYHFKIIVDKLCGTSTIDIYNGSILLGTISAAGSYDFYFTSQATNIQVIPNNISYGDCMEISYMQATRLRFDTLLTDDVALDPADISVINLKTGQDILVYCSPTSFTSNIKSGHYYYVIKSGGDFYFSEVFKIVSLKEIEQLYKLTWNHDCDFNNSVLYSSDTISCTFENILYLDAGLIKPEYDTTEESEINGQGDANVRFKRWQKNISLEIGKSPQFLTDALSAVFLHKNISVLEPLNYHQDVQNNLFSVLKVTSDISDILMDCYQTIKLKLLLEDKITDTACCSLAEIIDCTPCDFTAADSMETCETYWMYVVDGNGNWWSADCDVPRYSYTLKDCQGNVINTKETDLICFNGQYINLCWYQGPNCAGTFQVAFYYPCVVAPVIETTAVSLIGIYITGKLIPNTWGQAYFQPNCTGPWILADTFSVGDDGSFVFLYDFTTLGPYLPLTSLCMKVSNVTPNCDFGDTAVECVGTCI